MSETDNQLPTDIISESDYFKLAALDLLNITPTEIKSLSGRIWFYFVKNDAQPILSAYESGKLNGSLRDYAASLVRIKTKIFSIERERIGARNASFHR
jgi:hypothetical protein